MKRPVETAKKHLKSSVKFALATLAVMIPATAIGLLGATGSSCAMSSVVSAHGEDVHKTDVPVSSNADCTSKDTVPPLTNVTIPKDMTTLREGMALPITATAQDASGIAKVEFYIDGALQASDNTPPYTYTLDTTGLAPGPHTIAARAHDTFANTGSSQTVTFYTQDSPR